MENIFIVIPELNEPLFKKMYESPKKLVDYKGDYAQQVIEFVLAKMAGMTGGYKYFWTSEDSKPFVISGWLSGLKFMTAAQIFGTLSIIIQGKAQIGDSVGVPNSAIQFHRISTQGVHNRVAHGIDTTTIMLQNKYVMTEKDIISGKSRIAELRSILKPWTKT